MIPALSPAVSVHHSTQGQSHLALFSLHAICSIHLVVTGRVNWCSLTCCSLAAALLIQYLVGVNWCSLTCCSLAAALLIQYLVGVNWCSLTCCSLAAALLIQYLVGVNWCSLMCCSLAAALLVPQCVPVPFIACTGSCGDSSHSVIG